MSANAQLHDQAVQHAFHVLGYSNSVQGDVLKFLNDLERDTVERLAARLASDKPLSAGPSKRLEETIDEIRSLTRDVYSKTHDHLRKEFSGFAQSEAEFANKAINKAVKADLANKLPSPQLLQSIVTERPIHGKLLGPWLKGMGEATAANVEQQIRLGKARGDNTDKIVAAVRGPGGFEGSKASARTMVRTASASISNQAQQEAWKANSDLIKGWQFVATLDSRTTLICSNQDGKVYPLGEGPIPPLHPNCRSTTIAVTKDFADLGLKGNKYSAETRASMDGQVPAATTMDAYLKRKGPDIQDTIMGPTRADLYRRGKLTLGDFVRNYDQVIPLDELRRLHPDAFGGAAAAASEVVPPAAIVARAAKAFSPVNASVSAKTVKVEARLTVAKNLKAAFARNAADPAYDPNPEFRAARAADFGKAAFSADVSDEAASMIAAIMPEVDAITDAFGVPRLRAIKTGAGSYSATMGDGMLTIHPNAFNRWASEMGDGVPSAAKQRLTEQRDALREELTALRAKIDAYKVNLSTLRGVEKDAAILTYLDDAEKFNAKRDQFIKIDKKLFKLGNDLPQREVSTWKVGDDVSKRPHNMFDYFERPFDRARNVIYHEVGHHIHQMYQKVGRRNRVGDPPVEKLLRRRFYAKFTGIDAKAAKDLVASSYSLKNEKEWFAEGFSLYMQGRFDLIDPDVKDLIDDLLKGKVI